MQAAIDFENNRYALPLDQKKIDQAQYAMLHNILAQVLEINQLARERRLGPTEETLQNGRKAVPHSSVVAQLMIAEARGAEDVIALKTELEGLILRKSREDGRDYSIVIPLVPLFESAKTVAPESIQKYLETMWDEYNRDREGGVERFKEEINEIFIAGSDLSKEIGQTSALVLTWEALAEVVAFNRAHGTDVRVKLGTGEAPFRQGGFWDPEGHLPMVRGKILDHRRLSDDEAMEKFGKNNDWKNMRAKEEQLVGEQRTFLRETIGEDWKKVLLRSPRGYNRLLKAVAGLNSFTLQSRGKEFVLTNINTDRLARIRADAKTTHDTNMRAIATGELTPSPNTALKKAAEHERRVYESVFGRDTDEKQEGVPKSMFGQLLQFCAKSLPAPELRDRGLGRESSGGNDAVFFTKLAEPCIDARAISANTASGYLFPLYLIGKGSMLEAAASEGSLREVMQNGQVDAKELLRQMKLYEQVADDIFAMLREHGMSADAERLSEEWHKLLDRRADIQEEMWRQESPEGFDFTSLNDAQKKRLAECFVPGMRELIDDEFVSDRTILFKKSCNEHKSLIETAMEYVHAGHEWTQYPQDQAKKAAFEAAKHKKNLVTQKEYSRFLADVVTAYSPGM